MDHAKYSNTSLEVSQLPGIEQLALQPLARRYQVARLVVHGVICLICVIGLWLLSEQTLVPLAAHQVTLAQTVTMALLVIGPLLCLYAWFADGAKGYAMREQDLNFRSGLWFVRTVSQPITRIQHVELKQGPLDRQLALASLQVFSAGGSAHTFELPGIPAATAGQIRQYILAHRDVGRHG